MSDPLLAPVMDNIFDCSVLVVCDDRNRLGFYRDMLGERGYDVVCEEDPARIGRHLARDRRISVVFLDVAAGPWLEAPRTQTGAGVEYVIAADAGEDLAAAPPQAEKLVKPFGRGQLLGAVNSAFNLARLQRFRQEEMQTLENSLLEFKTRTLAAVSQLMARTQSLRSGGTPAPVIEPPGETSLQALAEDECRRARLRGRIFGPLGLSHTSWLLLMVMAEAQWAGNELTVKSTAYSAGLPLSSALRKINEMVARDLVEKREDPHDARRSFVKLAPAGLSYLTRYLSELSRDPGERARSAS